MGKCHLYHNKRNLRKRNNDKEIIAYLRELIRNQDDIIEAQKEIIASLRLKSEARFLTIKELAKEVVRDSR